MDKTLEKSLKDARKENRLILGAKQVRNALKDSKLIVLSRSNDGTMLSEQIKSGAKENNVPLVHFDGTSVALGKICGLQFRTSTVSFSSLAETSINAITRDEDSKKGDGT